MVKVRFRVNLGSMDAGRLDIENFRECVAGAEVEIHDPAAKVLEAAGVIDVLAEPEPKPKSKPKSVEPVEVKADPPAAATNLVADPPAVEVPAAVVEQPVVEPIAADKPKPKAK